MSRLGFEYPTFRALGDLSDRLRHRRGKVVLEAMIEKSYIKSAFTLFQLIQMNFIYKVS